MADRRPTDTETRDNGAQSRPRKSRIDSYANWSATQHHRRWPASSTPAAHRPTEDGARGRAAPPPEGSVVSSRRAKVEVEIMDTGLLKHHHETTWGREREGNPLTGPGAATFDLWILLVSTLIDIRF